MDTAAASTAAWCPALALAGDPDLLLFDEQTTGQVGGSKKEMRCSHDC